jgi:hypothetical protein
MKGNHFLFTLSIHIRATKILWNWQLTLFWEYITQILLSELITEPEGKVS